MSRNAFKLDVVSIRLVRGAPIYSDQKLNSPQAAVHLVGEVLCDMDRELVCVINLKQMVHQSTAVLSVPVHWIIP